MYGRRDALRKWADTATGIYCRIGLQGERVTPFGVLASVPGTQCTQTVSCASEIVVVVRSVEEAERTTLNSAVRSRNARRR